MKLTPASGQWDLLHRAACGQVAKVDLRHRR